MVVRIRTRNTKFRHKKLPLRKILTLFENTVFLLTGLEGGDRDIRERGAHSSLSLHSDGPAEVEEAGLAANLADLVLLNNTLQLLPDGVRENAPQLIVEGF
jgi:hypothetical protein